jgi:hypothetical protein
MLQENFEKLNDHFLDFDLSEINKYFYKKAWMAVKNLVNDKKSHSLCSIWYHYQTTAFGITTNVREFQLITRKVFLYLKKLFSI